MLTRAGVAKRLGKSIATVRRLEHVDLHPTRDARGVFRFREEEVEGVARRQARPSGDRRADSAPFRLPSRCETEGEQQPDATEARGATAHDSAFKSEREQFAQALAEANERLARANRLLEEREQVDLAHAASGRGHERLTGTQRRRRIKLRHEVAELLHSLTRRQLAHMAPADLEEILDFIESQD